MTESVERNLTLGQCIVGGLVGFGVLSGVLCLLAGGNLSFWISMTLFLTIVYTAYYFFRTRRRRHETD